MKQKFIVTIDTLKENIEKTNFKQFIEIAIDSLIEESNISGEYNIDVTVSRQKEKNEKNT